MAKKRNRAKVELAEQAIKVLLLFFLFAYAPVVAWWNNISPTGRILIISLITIAVLSAIGAIITLSVYIKRQRMVAWNRAMIYLKNNEQVNTISQKQSARYLNEIELEKFSAQLFAKMGYKVRHTGESGDHGVDVKLINPKGQVEIVQCKQWNKPVGEPQIRDLFGAMQHEKAGRGWLVAPRGFSEPARKWAKGKPIVLVDDKEVGRLIQSAYGTKK